MMPPICRTCLQTAGSATMYSANDTANAVRDRFSLCFPQMFLDIVYDAQICEPCYTMLCTTYEFHNICYRTETKISTYITNADKKPPFEILDMIVQLDDACAMEFNETSRQYTDVPDTVDLMRIDTFEICTIKDEPIDSTFTDDTSEFNYESITQIGGETDKEPVFEVRKEPLLRQDEDMAAKRVDKTGKRVKTSPHTWDVLLDFAVEHREIATGKFLGPNSKQLQYALWDELSERLNSLGGGEKTAAKWQKTFSDWKYNVKQKFINIKQLQAASGTGSPCHKKLTRQEEKLLSLIGLLNNEGETPNSDNASDFETLPYTIPPTQEQRLQQEELPTTQEISTDKCKANADLVQMPRKLGEPPVLAPIVTHVKKRLRESPVLNSSKPFAPGVRFDDCQNSTLDVLTKICISLEKLASVTGTVADNTGRIAESLNGKINFDKV